jgi:penicillin-binding protein-related factor A (putative recombinase)
MYYCPTLFTLELKSADGTSMTFYRDDFVQDGKKPTFMIKKNQINGLLESSKFKGIISGFILNFRKTNNTYFWDISDFVQCTIDLTKKSINETDVISHNGYLIEQTLKRTNYKYNIEKFITDIQNKKLKGESK